MRTKPFQSIVLAVALLSLLGHGQGGASEAVPPGIPEPGLVLWGQVVNAANPSQFLPIQSAEWAVTDGNKSAVFANGGDGAVSIVEVNGQFFYILEVPFDTRRLGDQPLSDPATRGLDSFELMAATPPTYILTPTINGVLAAIRSLNEIPASGDSLPVAGFTSLERGRVLRVDLAIAIGTESYETWAAGFFGDPNLPEAARTADPDGDGMTNEEEHAAGTDPTDPDSVLRLLTLTMNPNGADAQLEWKSVIGRQYILQIAPSVEGPWADMGGPVDGLEATTQAEVQVTPGLGRQFYRVRLAQ